MINDLRKENEPGLPPAADRFKISLFITGFLLFQAFMMLRCYHVDEKFFGWQMFSRPGIYRSHFYGVKEGGVRFPLPQEVYGRWIAKKGTGNFLAPKEDLRSFGRGKNFVLSQLKRVPAFLCGKLAAEGYKRIEVEVEHRDVAVPELTVDTYREDCH